MKTYYPKNINWSWLNLNFQIWPFSIGMIQLLLLAMGTATSLGLRNMLVKSWLNKWIAAVIAVPIMIIFFIIAFFNISELSLIEFITKKISANIIDEPIKYQRNIPKDDPIMIHMREAIIAHDTWWRIDTKESPNMDNLKTLEKSQDIF